MGFRDPEVAWVRERPAKTLQNADKAGAQLDHLEHPGVPVHQEILGYQRLLHKQQNRKASEPEFQKGRSPHA